MLTIRMLPLLLGALMATDSTAQIVVNRPSFSRDQIEFRDFLEGSRSRIDQQQLIDIPSENDFQRYWVRHTGQSATTTPTGIDWRREKLLAVHLGTRRSGGYSVRITGIERRAGVGIVRAVEQTPVRGGMNTQALTSPFVLVKVDRAAVRFELDLQTRTGGIGNGNVIIAGPGTVVIQPGQPPVIVGGWNPCPFTVVDMGICGPGFNPGVRSFGEPISWRRYWSRMSGRAENSAYNSLQWGTEQLAVLHVDPRLLNGGGFQILGIERRASQAIVRVLRTPNGNAKGNPYAVLRLPGDVRQFEVQVQPGN